MYSVGANQPVSLPQEALVSPKIEDQHALIGAYNVYFANCPKGFEGIAFRNGLFKVRDFIYIYIYISLLYLSIYSFRYIVFQCEKSTRPL